MLQHQAATLKLRFPYYYYTRLSNFLTRLESVIVLFDIDRIIPLHLITPSKFFSNKDFPTSLNTGF